MAGLKVHTHQSSPDAFYVNSFILEGNRSLILVDSQFVLSETELLIGKIKALGKPIAAIFVTHPHPDHYNGLASVLAQYPGTPIHATAATAAGIRETAEPKRDYWTPIVGSNYPQAFAYADTEITDGQRIHIDGMELVISDFGPAECSDNTMIALPQIDSVIISDLVYNRVHPWIAEGRSSKWLAALDAARGKLGGASMLYAGHGAAGTPAIIGEQASYLMAIRDAVQQAVKAEGQISESRKASMIEKISAQCPDWPLAMIIPMNIDGIAAEFAAA